MTKATVTFFPEGKSIQVETGTLLTVAAKEAGAFIDAPCGDRGVCGKCRVQVAPSRLNLQGDGVLAGLDELTAAERKALTAEEIAEGWRLACQATVLADATVRVPFGTLQTVLSGIQASGKLLPNARKVHVRLSEPTVADQRADVQRLREALARDGRGPTVRLEAARDLGQALRPADFAVTAVLVGDECIAVEPGDTSDEVYGVAVDIGTTSIVGALMDLTSGEAVAVASSLNGQASFGADVISRINFAAAGPEGLAQLQASVVGTINAILAELISRSGVPRERIYELVAVGNTTMSHLFLGINPSSLALAPYVAVNSDAYATRASELGIEIHPRGQVYMLPNIACFVGSDTVGVVLATRQHDDPRVRLAIDIGTNGEIVLGSAERLVACSTAAGPAFEGAEITFGMRATDGAIEKLWIEDDVVVRTINNGRPRGLCGSGLIDAVAEMLRVGLIDETGRLVAPEDAAQVLPEALCKRLVQTERGYAFVLAGAGRQRVYLTQQDVRKLQLAKGAISAGIQILMKELGLSGHAEIAEVLLAGAFGSYVSPASARAIGLVPPFPLSRLISVGNAASVGARMALLSMDARKEAEAIARRVEHIELSSRADFQDEFVTAMYFPAAGSVGGG
ncbi:MAG: ASKHA domain-containing protein [Chloroflexota bacterium]